MVGARDRDLAVLQRLAQGIEHLRLKLGELIEEQHAVMRERDFAPDATAAGRRTSGSAGRWPAVRGR